MLYAAQANRAHPLVATLVSTCLGILASSSGFAQPAGVVPITAEPDHKSRFDNGRVRMYEVVLPKGKATLMHEHRADSFTVFFRTAEVTNEPPEEASQRYSTEQQVLWDLRRRRRAHIRIASSLAGKRPFMSLPSPTPAGSATTAQRAGSAFKIALENPRGRVYRITLAPGESTEPFTRPAASALFAISAGRIREDVDGKPARLWDFEPGHFRWFEASEKLSVKNESPTSIDLVEIDVF
jgi:hypothetical protein